MISDPDRPYRWTAIVLLALVLMVQRLAFGQQWRPPVNLATHLFIRTDVIGVRPQGTGRLGGGTIEASPTRAGRLSLVVNFPISATDRAVLVEVRVRGGPGDDGTLRMQITSEITVEHSGGASSSIRRERTALTSEGSSVIHQACENPAAETSITLVLTPESGQVPELSAPSTGAPVLFRIAPFQQTDDGPSPLEESVVRAMEGSPVSVSIRLASGQSPPSSPTAAPPPAASAPTAMSDPPAPATGGSGSDEAKGPGAPFDFTVRGTGYDELELTLLPTHSSEGILLVEATLRGFVQGSGGLGGEVLLHKTQAVTSNGIFALDVAPRGIGGAGYRFQVQVLF